MSDIVLTCDDFIKSGFLKAESCCPYCHQDNSLLFTEDYILLNIHDFNMKAVLCCNAVKYIEALTLEQWNKTMKDKEMLAQKYGSTLK